MMEKFGVIAPGITRPYRRDPPGPIDPDAFAERREAEDFVKLASEQLGRRRQGRQGQSCTKTTPDT